MAKKPTQPQQDDTDEMAWELPGIPSGANPETLPKVHAEECVPNQECNMTPNCRGRIHAFNTITQTQKDEAGQIHRRRIQQLKCTHCHRIAEGFRVVSQPTGPGQQKLWNRHAKN
jgi:hypothetical protein